MKKQIFKLKKKDPNFVLGSQKYEIEEAIKSSKNLGKKTITYPGSFVIIVNNISGPGMLGIPLVFQQGLKNKTKSIFHFFQQLIFNKRIY